MIEVQAATEMTTATTEGVTLPENMPDGRAAQRLLSLLNQLEAAWNAPKKVPVLLSSGAEGSPAPTETSATVAQLRAENESLKTRQVKALARLDDLLERLQTQSTPSSTPNQPQPLSPTHNEETRA